MLGSCETSADPLALFDEARMAWPMWVAWPRVSFVLRGRPPTGPIPSPNWYLACGPEALFDCSAMYFEGSFDMGQTPDMRFYSPWTIREGSKGFQVEDATGFPLLYVPFEDEASRAIANKRMNMKQARALALKITQMMNDLDRLRSAIDKATDSGKLKQPIGRPDTTSAAALTGTRPN